MHPVMEDHVSRGSSPVDWCEENYSYSPIIAEFYNTVSNAIFLVMPPFLMHLHTPYSNSMGPGIQVIWTLLIVVGASSAYFHATLSLLGQLLDELAILWVIMAGFAMWFPKHVMPKALREDRGRRKFVMAVSSYASISIDKARLFHILPFLSNLSYSRYITRKKKPAFERDGQTNPEKSSA